MLQFEWKENENWINTIYNWILNIQQKACNDQSKYKDQSSISFKDYKSTIVYISGTASLSSCFADWAHNELIK